MNIVEVDDGWSLRATDEVVTSVMVDWAVTLTIGSAGSPAELRIEQTFTLTGPDGNITELDPEGDPADLAPALRLVRAPVARVDAHSDGSLELVLADDTVAAVQPSPDYEAWTIAAPDGFKLVSLPGGDLAVWRAGT